jgi:(p)ppGpp synthase/HD superfamily hydrolase
MSPEASLNNGDGKSWSLSSSKERNPITPLEEFMEIRDINLAKAYLLNAASQRFNSPLRRERKLVPANIDSELGRISSAFDFAKIKHIDQKRLTGEDYIFHTIAVAYAGVLDRHTPLDELTTETISALCHDILEDTNTLPSELRNTIGPDSTADVIRLSKKIKAFELNPVAEFSEIDLISDGLLIDQKELILWFNRRTESHGNVKIPTTIYLLSIIRGPKRIRRIKLRDRKHNLSTIPSLNPPENVTRTEAEQTKINKIHEGIIKTKKLYAKMAMSLGVASLAAGFRLGRKKRI